MLKKSKHLFKIVISFLLLAVMIVDMTSCGVLFLPLVFCDSNNSNDEITETHDIKDFLDKTYLEYNGGKDAEVFFNEFAYINNYKDIAFHYKDGEKGNYLNNEYYQHTVFVLDVYYPRDIFLEVSDKILLELVGQKAEDIFLLYDGKQAVAFSGYKVEKSDSVYKENIAAVLFDPRYNTIRYAFLCNNVGSVYKLQEVTIHVLNVSLNSTEKDWVFDYSDITLEDYTNLPKES